ncbi:MAG: hypothetical protein OEM62_12280, partial [Acidobacteriota bacterium]|nr:hypothetical protein [Acidobacteriota bacterium]
MRDNAMRERDVEERLTGIESPEPPADLLDRIRGDIPRYAQPAARGDSGASGGGFTWRRSRLLAASVFLAVVGGLLAYRVSQEVLEPTGTPATTADDRIEVPDDRATTEVGPQIAAVEDASRGDTGPPTGKVLADAEARGDDGPEMKEMRYHDELAVEGQTGHRVASPATLEAEEPVAVSGDEVLQESFRTGEATSTEIGEVRADAPGSRKASRRRESGPGDETGRNERDGLPSGGPKRVVVDTDAVSGTPQTTVSGQSGTDREVASAESEFAAR